MLLNDVANGGFRTFRAGVTSSGFKLAVQAVGSQIVITWAEPGTMLQESTNLSAWATLPAAASPYQVTPGARPFVFYRLIK